MRNLVGSSVGSGWPKTGCPTDLGAAPFDSAEFLVGIGFPLKVECRLRTAALYLNSNRASLYAELCEGLNLSLNLCAGTRPSLQSVNQRANNLFCRIQPSRAEALVFTR